MLPRVDAEEIIRTLLTVFRTYGYDGTSLSILSEATSLQRASLYHRFPGGKEEMVQRVLEHVEQYFVSVVLAPLSENSDPRGRVRRMAKEVAKFYEDGGKSCVLDTLSLTQSTLVRDHVRRLTEAWLAAMEKVAAQSGHGRQVARRVAEDALSAIQGSLVIARTTGDPKVFRRVLTELPEMLTKGG